jgi:hypothetical protein
MEKTMKQIVKTQEQDEKRFQVNNDVCHYESGEVNMPEQQ